MTADSRASLRSSAFVAGGGALLAGILVAVQARLNGQLALLTGSGVEAAAVSFGTGWVILTVLLVASRPVRAGVRGVVDAVRQGRLRPWQLLGGMLGGFVVFVQSATVPIVGVAVFTVALVAGQSVNSLVVDRAGLGPAGRQPITGARVLSAALAIMAVLIAVSDRVTGPTAASVPSIVAALIAGVLVAVQQAINGRVGAAAGNGFTAAWFNFALGCIFLGVLFGLAWALTDTDPGALPSGPWWIYAGGALGVLFIATAAWVVQRLGVLLFALISIAGQLMGALLLDWVAPTPGATFHMALVAGVLLAGIAVAVGALPTVLARRAH